MAKKIGKYKITHHTGETACEVCGAPLYVGDTAYHHGDEDAAYCSRECATPRVFAYSFKRKKSGRLSWLEVRAYLEREAYGYITASRQYAELLKAGYRLYGVSMGEDLRVRVFRNR